MTSTARALLVGMAVSVLSLALVGLVGIPDGRAQEGDDNGLVVVMDASGSMVDDAGGGQTRIQAARDAGTSLVRALPDEARVGLIAYGHRVENTNDVKPHGCRDVETIRPVGPLDREQFVRDIRSFGPSGWTPIGAALEQAADELADVPGRRTIVLVSDGIDTCAPPDPCRVAEDLATEGVDLAIETVGFQVDAEARDQLECIAEATGGSYRDAPDAASLADSIRALSLRAFRAYEPTGDPITGGDSAAQATPMEPGQYVDQVRADQPRFYTFDVAPGQNFVLTAVLVGDTDRESAVGVVQIDVSDPDGSCGGNGTSGSLGAWAVASGLVGGPDEDCADGGPFVAAVGIEDFDPDTGANQPFPVELRLLELPPGSSIPPPEGLEAVTPDDEVVAGSSYGDAPLVAPGTYRGDIRTGERQYWAIEVGRGQELTVSEQVVPGGIDEQARMYLGLENGAQQSGRFGDDTVRDDEIFPIEDGATLSIEPGPADEATEHRVMQRPGIFYVSTLLQEGPPTALLDYEITFTLEGDPVPDPTPSPTATPTPSPSVGPTTSPTTSPTPSAEPSPSTTAAGEPTEVVTEAAPPDDGGGGNATTVLLGLLALVAVAVAAWLLGRRSTATATPTDDQGTRDGET